MMDTTASSAAWARCRAALDHASKLKLSGLKPLRLCGLSRTAWQIADDTVAWSELAPDGIAAVDGWVEGSDRVELLTKGKPCAHQPSLLSADGLLGAQASLRLRRDGRHIRALRIQEWDMAPDLTQWPDGWPVDRVPCLAHDHWLLASTPTGARACYTRYWGLAPQAAADAPLRPLFARLSQIRRPAP